MAACDRWSVLKVSGREKLRFSRVIVAQCRYQAPYCQAFCVDFENDE